MSIAQGVFVMGDVPTQPRLTEAWTHSAGAFRALVESLDQCIYVLNREGRFVCINQAFQRWLDRPEPEILGCSTFDVWPQPTAEKEALENQRVLQGERLEGEDARPRGGAGELAAPRVRYLKAPVRDGEGIVRGVLTLFREVAATLPGVPVAEPVSPSRSLEQPTILLGESDARILQMAQTILRRSGYIVLPAETGREMLDTYRRHQAIIDLVILDQQLTDQSGLDTLNELLMMKPDLRLVLVSAGGPLGSAWARQTPGWKTLSKPYNAIQLAQMVREALASGERPA